MVVPRLLIKVIHKITKLTFKLDNIWQSAGKSLKQLKVLENFLKG